MSSSDEMDELPVFIEDENILNKENELKTHI
jgi:hypothetical protein